MPQRLMLHENDPREELLAKLGSLDDIEIFDIQVLVAVYIRPEKTKSGLYITQNTRDEDKYQSKVGLVIKLGPDAFDDPVGQRFGDIRRDGDHAIQEGDWIVFKPSEGWGITIGDQMCRILKDVDVKGRVSAPDQVW